MHRRHLCRIYTLPLYTSASLFPAVPSSTYPVALAVASMRVTLDLDARTRASHGVQTLRPSQRLLLLLYPLALHLLINYRALSRRSGPALPSGTRNSRVTDELAGVTRSTFTDRDCRFSAKESRQRMILDLEEGRETGEERRTFG